MKNNLKNIVAAIKPKMEEDSYSEDQTPAPILNQVAYSFYKTFGEDGKPNGWNVVKINFDSNTGYVTSPQIVSSTESESEALNLFKVSVANDLLRRNRPQ